MGFGTLLVALNGDPTIRDIARFLEATEMIYNRCMVITAHGNELTFKELMMSLRSPARHIGEQDRVRILYIKRGSLEILVEGVYTGLAVGASTLGVLKVWLHLRTKAAEARKAEAEATVAEVKALTEIRQLSERMRIDSLNEFVNFVSKAGPELKRLGLEEYSSACTRLIEEQKRLVDYSLNTKSHEQQRSIMNSLLEPLKKLKNLAISRIELK